MAAISASAGVPRSCTVWYMDDHLYGATTTGRLMASDMPFSGTEKKAVRLLRDGGMPFVLQYELRVNGRLIRPGDLVMPDIKLDLELDGPHHWMPEQAAIDRRNDTALRMDDWVVERVPVYDVDDDPSAFVADTARVVQRVKQMRGAQVS